MFFYIYIYIENDLGRHAGVYYARATTDVIGHLVRICFAAAYDVNTHTVPRR